MSLTTHTGDADDASGDWRVVLPSVANRRTLAGATVLVAALGLLPLYESLWWWDVLTHTLSGGAIAAWLVVARRRPAHVLLVLAALSGAWELVEYATPAFAFMAGSAADTAADVACNFLGAAAVVAVARRSRGGGDGGAAARSGTVDAGVGPTDD